MPPSAGVSTWGIAAITRFASAGIFPRIATRKESRSSRPRWERPSNNPSAIGSLARSRLASSPGRLRRSEARRASRKASLSRSSRKAVRREKFSATASPRNAGRASIVGSTDRHCGDSALKAAMPTSSGRSTQSTSVSASDAGWIHGPTSAGCPGAGELPNPAATIPACSVCPVIAIGQPTAIEPMPSASRTSQSAGRARSAAVTGRSVRATGSPVSPRRIACSSGHVPVIADTTIASRASAIGKWSSARAPPATTRSSAGRAPRSSAARKAGAESPSRARNRVFMVSLLRWWRSLGPMQAGLADGGRQGSSRRSRSG